MCVGGGQRRSPQGHPESILEAQLCALEVRTLAGTRDLMKPRPRGEEYCGVTEVDPNVLTQRARRSHGAPFL